MTYQTHVLSQSPLLYLPFQEPSGFSGTWVDASGNGHDGTVAVPTVNAGAADGFLEADTSAVFSGRGGEVDFAMGTPFDTISAFSLEYWVQIVANDDDLFDIDFLFTGSSNISTDLLQNSEDEVQFYISWRPAGDLFNSSPIHLRHPHCWHHWCFTYDGTILNTYLDGQLADTINDVAIAGRSFTPSFGGAIENAGGFSSTFNVAHLAFYGSALSADAVAGNYSAATPRQDSDCFPPDTLQLKHKDGTIDWQHDSITMRIKSRGVDQIVSPLPTLTAVPALLVGKDPASDVLAFCPEAFMPRARSDILTAPPVPTATVDLCTQLRCGVADACTGHLLSLYSNWARWLSPLFALLGTLAVAAFIEEILPMLLAEEASASTLAIWQEFKPEIQGIIGVFTGNLLPLPTSDTTSDIQKMLFCQMACEEGVVRPTVTQINGWRDAFLAYPDWAISSLQGQLLELLTKFTPLEDWLIAAEGASTSSACDDWTCP